MIANYITGMQHIGIPTNDVEETIAFYKKLGFETAFEAVNGPEKVAFLKLGDIVVETYQSGLAAHIPGAVDHIALDTSDIEAAYKAAEEAGFLIQEGGIQFLPFWENGVKFFKITGPNDESIEFCQRL